MLQQEREFGAWGLSKFAVRNIVVFFITSLIAAVIVLYRANERLQDKVLSCEKEQATRVQELERLHREGVQKLYQQMIERADKHSEQLKSVGSTLQKSRRK